MVLNPLAARGRAGRQEGRLVRALEAVGLRPVVRRTRAPGHAAELVRQAAVEGLRVICAAGGDGTLHEAVNGLLELPPPERPALGVIPLGSANDFAKMLHLRPGIEEAARRLAAGGCRPVDAGRAGSRFFINGMGMGFDAQVARESASIPFLGGTPLYLLATLRALWSYPCPQMEIEVDGRAWRCPTLLCSVSNGACIGGGFWIAPQAAVDDGWLDVCHASGLGRAAILRLLPEIMRGTHVGKEPVRLERARRVRLRSDTPLHVHADGELLPLPLQELEVEVLPRALVFRS